MLDILIDVLVVIWFIGAVFSLIGACVLASYGTRTGIFAPLIASALWPVLSMIFMFVGPWENWRFHRRCKRAYKEEDEDRAIEKKQTDHNAL